MTPPTTTTLLDLSEDALGKVMEYLDLEAILTLRKVCRDLRNYFEDKPPDICLQSIQLEFRPNSIYTCYECCEFLRNIEYHSHRDGCTVEVGIHQKILAGKNFLNTFFDDFRVILSHQKSILNQFEVEFGADDPEKIQKIFENFFERKFYLKVKIIKIQILNQENLSTILNFLAPKFLEEIRIFPFSAEKNSMEISKIFNSEQWKNLKLFYASSIYLSLNPTDINNFLHLEQCYCGIQEITMEDMRMVKENFVTSPIPISFRFTFQVFHDRQKFLEYLGPVSCSNPNSGLKEWYFGIGDYRNPVLHVHLNDVFVNFDRIDFWKVPKGVTVLK